MHTLSRSDSPTPVHTPAVGEALVEQHTPPQSPMLAAQRREEKVPKLPGGGLQRRQSEPTAPFVRPFYEMIVDGIHLHPNSVRVRAPFSTSHVLSLTLYPSSHTTCIQRAASSSLMVITPSSWLVARH